MTNWENIHEYFKYEWCQKEWQEKGFDYQTAKEWIDSGFGPQDSHSALNWKNQGFTPPQAQEWIKTGLTYDEYDFAAYLRKNYHQPTTANLETLRKEYYDAQTWLDWNYPQEERENITDLNIEFRQLEGSLKLENFTNLKQLNCANNLITRLEFINCPNLKDIFCSFNEITGLNIKNCPNLESLVCQGSLLTNLDLSQNSNLEVLDINGNNFFAQDLSFLSHLVNLKELRLGNFYQERIDQGICNRFYGSLEPLKNLVKLNCLDVSNTEIDSGIEYLPQECLDNLEDFYGTKIYQDLKKQENDKLVQQEVEEGMKIILQIIRAKNEDEQFSHSDFDQQAEIVAKKINIWSQEELEHFLKSWSKNLAGHVQENDDWQTALPYLKQFKTMAEKRLIALQKKQSIEDVEAINALINSNFINEPDVFSLETRISSSPTVPSELVSLVLKKDKTLENHYFDKKIVYDKIYPDFPLELGQNRENKLLLEEKLLPTKLYDIENNHVEVSRNNLNIKNYVILSYVWGDPAIKTAPEIENYSWWRKELTASGNKTLHKAIQTCKHLGINYLWMDQLCIDQSNNAEKEKEVPKMRQYYRNADLTLIAIQTKLGKDKIEQWLSTFEKGEDGLIDGDEMVRESQSILATIFRSEWIERRWTFQEGWLSKQTIFMFDDVLIDGRLLALIWGIKEKKVGKFNTLEDFFKKYTKEIATPVGWSYCKAEEDFDDTISLRLDQALRAAKARKSWYPIDGIYSILGLLPYGDKVEVSYDKDMTPEEALENVMIAAVKEGYGEPLAWMGTGSKLSGKCWLPAIDENGSTSIVEGIDISLSCESMVEFKDNGIEISGEEYEIMSDNTLEISEVEPQIVRSFVSSAPRISQSEVEESTLSQGDFQIKVGSNQEWVTLLGKKTTLELAATGNNSLMIPDKVHWKSDVPFAILVTKNKDDSSIRHRVDLVKILDGADGLNGSKKRQFILGSNKQEVQHTTQYETKIGIPLKWKQ